MCPGHQERVEKGPEKIDAGQHLGDIGQQVRAESEFRWIVKNVARRVGGHHNQPVEGKERDEPADQQSQVDQPTRPFEWLFLAVSRASLKSELSHKITSIS